MNLSMAFKKICRLDYGTLSTFRVMPRTVPRVQTKHGEAAFSYSAPESWNKLPDDDLHQL